MSGWTIAGCETKGNVTFPGGPNGADGKRQLLLFIPIASFKTRRNPYRPRCEMAANHLCR